jgi:hypothetical protein
MKIKIKNYSYPPISQKDGVVVRIHIPQGDATTNPLE